MARRADLADGTFTVNVRASRGTSNTAFTASLDAVSVTIAYTVPVAGSAPTYDDDGNMTSDGTYGNRTYSYDTLGRLTLVAGGGASTSYILVGFGNRWSQSTGAVTTSFDLDLLPGNATILSDGNPYEALEFALMLNPVGAILVMGYQVITGTDPATRP